MTRVGFTIPLVNNKLVRDFSPSEHLLKIYLVQKVTKQKNKIKSLNRIMTIICSAAYKL